MREPENERKMERDAGDFFFEILIHKALKIYYFKVMLQKG
jgi:hypothetical protein